MRERRLIWAILSLTLVASAFSALQVPRVKAEGVTVSITPAHNAYDAGENFTITIDIADVYGLHAWELKLKYVPAPLYTNYSATGPPPVSLIQKGTFLSGNGLRNTYFAPPYFGPGYIQFGELITTQDWADGSGTLVSITFIVQTWGCGNLEILDLSLLDVDSNPIDPTINNGTFHNDTPNAGIFIFRPNWEPETENIWFNCTREAAYKLKFNVTVWNTGTGAQTFNVAFYYNSSKTWDPNTLVGFTQVGSPVAVNNLAELGSQLVQFSWDPAGIRGRVYNYTETFIARIYGMASDGFADDNLCRPPLGYTVKILMGGDCNGDGRINYKDLNILAPAYGSVSTSPNYNPRADFNGDKRVNYKDLNIMAPVYGKVYLGS